MDFYFQIETLNLQNLVRLLNFYISSKCENDILFDLVKSLENIVEKRFPVSSESQETQLMLNTLKMLSLEKESSNEKIKYLITLLDSKISKMTPFSLMSSPINDNNEELQICNNYKSYINFFLI